MAATIPSDLGQGLVPEGWGPRFLAALYDEHYVLPHVLNVTADFKGKGDIVNIATEPAYTVNDVTGATGAVTLDTVTITNVTLTIDKNKSVASELTGIARDQAFENFENRFPISAGKALRQQMDSDLLALCSDATATSQGDGLGNLGEDELLGAIQQLVTAKVPIMESPEECCFAMADTQFAPLKKQNFLDYNRSGQAGGGAAKIGLASIWSIPVVFSTQVASASSIRESLLFHRSALAWAAQRNVVPRFADRLPAAVDGYLMAVFALYGVKTTRAARMVRLRSKA